MAYIQSLDFTDQISNVRLRVSANITPTSDEANGGRVTIGAVESTISTAVTVVKWLLVNRGTTDTIDIGVATGVYPYKIGPGDWAIIPITDATLFCISSGTADLANLEFRAIPG